MTAAVLLDHPEQARAYVDSLEKFPAEPLADGQEPESRVVLCGKSWEFYLAFDKALGDDRPGPRFYYLDGELEIMSTSEEHERLKMRFTVLMDLYFSETGIEAADCGQATMRLNEQQVGAEPDVSWRLDAKQTFADIALEIALTSGGIRKLELYRRFAVPEVWIWRHGRLEVFVLRADGSGYDPAQGGRSRLLPGLNLGLLERCAVIPSRQEARRTFLAGLTATRD